MAPFMSGFALKWFTCRRTSIGTGWMRGKISSLKGLANIGMGSGGFAIPWNVQNLCGCSFWGHGLVVTTMTIVEGFSSLNGAGILWSEIPESWNAWHWKGHKRSFTQMFMMLWWWLLCFYPDNHGLKTSGTKVSYPSSQLIPKKPPAGTCPNAFSTQNQRQCCT